MIFPLVVELIWKVKSTRIIVWEKCPIVAYFFEDLCFSATPLAS
jgi:hypothetical protein